MAEDNTQPLGVPDGGAEPTTPVPRPSGDWTPSQVPESPWSRTGYPHGPNWTETTSVDSTSTAPTTPLPGQPAGSAASASTYNYPGQFVPEGQLGGAADGAVYPPRRQSFAGAQPPAGQPAAPLGSASATGAPVGPGQAYVGHYAAPPGYQAPYQPDASASSQYGNFGSGGYPPPGYYQPQYYEAPPPKPKRRWPVVVLALVVAFVLAGAGFELTRVEVGATAQPEVTTVPSQANEPSSKSSTGTTQSKSVSAAQSKGVVLIEAETAEGTAYGTGMVLAADGKVLTNYHVVAGSEKLAVTIADSGDTYTATVLGFDQTRDVALLQLSNASGLSTVTIDEDKVSVGDQIAAVGNASGAMELVKASGSVTGTDQALTVSSDSPWGSTEDLSGLVATSAGAVPGDSGGPMFDSEAEVLGMTTAGSTKDHTSYAVPISTALAVVQQIETGQDSGTVRVGPAGYLGVRVADSSYTGVGGATVSAVVSGSPAAKAGITSGSRLTKVGDVTITSKTNVASVIRAVEPGTQVKITWITSSGATKHATVTMGASPVN
jgi:S1-C subfamily serine protease